MLANCYFLLARGFTLRSFLAHYRFGVLRDPRGNWAEAGPPPTTTRAATPKDANIDFFILLSLPGSRSDSLRSGDAERPGPIWRAEMPTR